MWSFAAFRPITPKVSPACSALPRGFNCSGSTATPADYTICPGGETESCSDGDQCAQVSPGVISCRPVPGAVCANKPPGLFCDPNSTAAKPGWCVASVASCFKPHLVSAVAPLGAGRHASGSGSTLLGSRRDERSPRALHLPSLRACLNGLNRI